MSKSYWVEKDKKVSPHNPTLMYSEPWPPAENEKEAKPLGDDNDVKKEEEE